MTTPAEQLEEYINATGHTEHECRAYLQYVKHILMPSFPVRYPNQEIERTGNLGRSDYIISGEFNEGGVTCVHAYIWELKAPQCYIFERDPGHTGRLRPTAEFLDAENKLLHFYMENKHNALFHLQYNIPHPAPKYVHMGGIIIGSNETKVSGVTTVEERDQLYKTTKTARDYLYEPAKIKFITWDDVLRHMQTERIVQQERVGTEEEIDVSEVSPDTISVFSNET